MILIVKVLIAFIHSAVVPNNFLKCGIFGLTLQEKYNYRLPIVSNVVTRRKNHNNQSDSVFAWLTQ